MASSKAWIVARREYLSIVTKKSFWAVTLLFPLLILVLGGISALSNKAAEQSQKNQVGEAKQIDIYDPGKVIDEKFVKSPLARTTNREESLANVKAGRIDGLVVYPSTLGPGTRIDIYVKETGIAQRGRFEPLATSLLKNTILERVGDPRLIAVYNADVPVETTAYQSGQPAKDASALIVPGVFIVLFYMLIVLSSNTLLTSMTEEKENRVIEMLLISIRSRDLLWGKLLGLTGVGITQLVLALGLAVGVAVALKAKLPFGIDLAHLVLDPGAIALAFTYTIAGYLLYAALMAGIGAIVPTAKEAGGFVAVIIIAALSPFYFLSALIADPTGPTAMISSYFPLTAPLVLLIRNMLGALPAWEIALSVGAMAVYISVAFALAVKLFQIGALEYASRVSLKRLFDRS